MSETDIKMKGLEKDENKEKQKEMEPADYCRFCDNENQKEMVTSHYCRFCD